MKENHKNSNGHQTYPSQLYQTKNYSHLLGMKGFSNKLLTDHFKLYEGYVKNTNEALEKLSHAHDKEPLSIEINELRRRFGWEWNGMRLHEYYFDNLGGNESLSADDSMSSLIKSNFGNETKWKNDFIATGMMRGIGWVILYQDNDTGRLINTWIEEHQANHLSGAQPLLVMDVFEHAFITDYGTDKGKYIEAFFNNINWQEVARRRRVELVPA